MPRQVDAAGRRSAIGAAALAVIAADGFAAVTIRRVAQQLGASTTAITHYVDGRDDLVRLGVGGLLHVRQAEAAAAVGPAEDGAGLRRLVRWATADVPPDEQGIWLDLVAGARVDAVLRDVLDDFNAWWDDLIAQLATAAVAAGRGGGRPAGDVADLVTVVVDGAIVAAFDGGVSWDGERVAQAVDTLLAALDL